MNDNGEKNDKNIARPAIPREVFNSLKVHKAKLEKDLSLNETMTWETFFIIVDIVFQVKYDEVLKISTDLIEGNIEKYLSKQ